MKVYIFTDNNKQYFIYKTIIRENVFFEMAFLFLLHGCNLSCIVDLFAILLEFTSARAHITKALINRACASLNPRDTPYITVSCANHFTINS